MARIHPGKEIDSELVEALPPALASFPIFQFLWNDLLMALIFVHNSDLWPMTIRINQMQSQFGGEGTC